VYKKKAGIVERKDTSEKVHYISSNQK